MARKIRSKKFFPFYNFLSLLLNSPRCWAQGWFCLLPGPELGARTSFSHPYINMSAYLSVYLPSHILVCHGLGSGVTNITTTRTNTSGWMRPNYMLPMSGSGPSGSSTSWDCRPVPPGSGPPGLPHTLPALPPPHLQHLPQQDCKGEYMVNCHYCVAILCSLH